MDKYRRTWKPPTVNIKGDKGYFYTPHISEDGILTWSNNGNLENPQPFNISDLILNEVKESRVDTTGKTFSKLKERLDSDFKKLSESIKNNDTKDEVVQARTATTGENFMTLDDRIDHEVMRLRNKIEVTMLEQEDKESHDISNTIDGMSSDMVIKGKTIKLDNGEIKSFGQEENKISILSSGKNLWDGTFTIGSLDTRSGVEVNAGENRKRSNFISIEKLNTDKITITQYDSIDRIYVHVYDENKNIIGNVYTGNLNFYPINDKLSVTLPSNAKFLRFRTENNRDLKPTSIQIEEGTQSTSYQEYISNKKDILLSQYGFDEGLRELIQIYVMS